MSDLLQRVKVVRALMPGVLLQEAKQLVETGADEILARRLGAAEEALRRRVDADRRERIATRLAVGMLAGEVDGLDVEDFYSEEALAQDACNYADALIAELDRRSAVERRGEDARRS